MFFEVDLMNYPATIIEQNHGAESLSHQTTLTQSYSSYGNGPTELYDPFGDGF